jgi:aspartate aminotransferase
VGQLRYTIKNSGHFTLLDMAYQGFAPGDTNKEAYALRHFGEQGHPEITKIHSNM